MNEGLGELKCRRHFFTEVLDFEGDIFRIIVPVNDEYSFDYEIGNETSGKTSGKLTQTEESILVVIREYPDITQPQLAEQIGISLAGIRYAVKCLKEKGILSRKGSSRKGVWEIRK